MTRGRDWVALILAVGLATAINCLTFAMLYEAIFRTDSAGLSENATQVLTTAFGGIIGVLGSYIGYKAGSGQPPTPGQDEAPSDQDPTAPL